MQAWTNTESTKPDTVGTCIPRSGIQAAPRKYPVQHGDRLEGRVAALPEVGRHAVARIADQRDARPRHRQMAARNEDEPQLGESVHELIRSHSSQFEKNEYRVADQRDARTGHRQMAARRTNEPQMGCSACCLG